MAEILVLAAKIKIGEDSLTFSDSEKLSEWAKPYVNAVIKAGLMNEMGNNEFAPLVLVSRAQAAQAIYNLIK